MDEWGILKICGTSKETHNYCKGYLYQNNFEKSSLLFQLAVIIFDALCIGILVRRMQDTGALENEVNE